MASLPITFTPITSGWILSPGVGPVPERVAGRHIPATVPGCVHTDLLRVGLIDDPFDADNESSQHWIGRTDWHYTTTFRWSGDAAARHDVVAYGLDTIATIRVNGQEIGRTQNQHRSYRFDVGPLLRIGDNELAVSFSAPIREAERRVAEHGAWPHVNAHPFNQLRKSASNFGWDWGIDAATAGIWRPIGLEAWSDVRIASVRPLVSVEGGVGIATVHVDIERADPTQAVPIDVHVTVGDVAADASVPAGSTCTSVCVRVPDAQLWWPVGYGAQPLYDVTVTVDDARAAWTGRIGFRTVDVDTTPDVDGDRFVLRVNGQDIAVRGVNWIPDHAFVTEVDHARYRRRLADALEANTNLIRVWGGGIYESDELYDLADEAGVLMWQDFLFACAAYPEEAWLADEIDAEAREQVTRLSPHPSLVVWNGTNESTWAYVEWGWRPELAGRAWGDGYYTQMLPAILAELDPTRVYTPSSPFSSVSHAHPNDPRNGTMHIWDVWNERDYTDYRQHAPRFLSEFGFQGPPAWSTLTRVVHDAPLSPYGPQMLVHQKAEQGNLKLERGMTAHLPTPTTIEDWHWAAQLNQAQAIRFGVEHFRSLAPHTAGLILWQLNDNWPVVSWSAVDFDEHRKPLWYALRDAYAPRLATVQEREGRRVLVLVNDTAEAAAGPVRVSRRTLGGTLLATATLEFNVGARSVITLDLPTEVADIGDADDELIVAEPHGFARAIFNAADVRVQRLDPEAAHLEAALTEHGYSITVTARSYLRDVFLAVDRLDPRAVVDTGMVSLLAGESAAFTVRCDTHTDLVAIEASRVVRCANDLRSATACGEGAQPDE